MKQNEGINEDIRGFIHEYFVKPQLLDSEDGGEIAERTEGLNKVIQKGFIKYAVLNWGNLEDILEDDDMNAIHEALSKKESRKVANQIFEDAIDSAKKLIAVEFGMAPKRKLAHEILSEELDTKFGEGHINKNINDLIKKSTGNREDSDCDDGYC